MTFWQNTIRIDKRMPRSYLVDAANVEKSEVSFNLYGCDITGDLNAFVDVLIQNTSIKDVYVKISLITNRAQIDTFMRLMRARKLRLLFVAFVYNESPVVRSITNFFDTLCEFFKENGQLQQLYISDFSLPDVLLNNIFDSLAENTHVENFCYNSKFISNPSHLISMLNTNKTMHTLSFEFAGSLDDMCSILEVIAINGVIGTLMLQFYSLKDTHLPFILKRLLNCRNVHTLTLASDISIKNADAIIDFLEANESVSSFSTEAVHVSSDKLKRLFDVLLKNNTLVSLSFGCPTLNASNIHLFTQFIENLTDLKSLCIKRVSHSFMTKENFDILCAGLRSNNCLTKFDFQPFYSHMVQETFKTILQKNQSLFEKLLDQSHFDSIQWDHSTSSSSSSKPSLKKIRLQ